MGSRFLEHLTAPEGHHNDARRQVGRGQRIRLLVLDRCLTQHSCCGTGWAGLGRRVFVFFFFLFPSSLKRKKLSCVHKQTDGQEKGDGCSEMNAGHINLLEQG